MRPIRTAFLLAGALLAAAACGHKGAILAPLTRVPKPVGALTAGQKGGRVLLKWTAPGAYIDDRPLPSSAVYEIWLLRNDKTEAALDRNLAVTKLWPRAFKLGSVDIYGRPLDAAAASPAGPAGEKSLAPKTEIDWDWAMTPEDWKATRLIVGVRVNAGKRSFSDFIYMGWWPRTMPAAPGKPSAKVFADRIEVRWTAPALNMDGTKPPLLKGYNVYRASPGQRPILLNSAPIAVPYYMDRAFEFGKPYVYAVRALTGDRSPYVETEASEGLAYTAVDTFPPAPPKKPTAVTAVGLVTLIWEAGPGEAAAGFRVWRKIDDAEFKLLTPQAIMENTFTDTTVERGHRYEYAVSAVDAAGNESARSESLTEIIKDAQR